MYLLKKLNSKSKTILQKSINKIDKIKWNYFNF